jgi:Ca2+-transporting ATPase
MIASQGAPEAIADLCHLDGQRRQDLLQRATAMAGEGLRVLGVTQGHPVAQGDVPQKQHDFAFAFFGLVGLADPIRPTVPGAIQECYSAGIRVVMITGDYPATAQSIGRQIGLRSVGEIVTGPELDRMDEEQLRQRLVTANIIARVVPEQKLRIVNALKAAGEIVAMTGDGVNDAPALKSAHIGIAMGGRGTDVAREAAGPVLLDDDFSSIVQAVRLGRRIFDNSKKAVSYIFAIHVPIAGLSLIPVFFSDWPFILLPVHIVFLELIIDPSCTPIFEAESAEPNTMTRPPRDPREGFVVDTSCFAVLLFCITPLDALGRRAVKQGSPGERYAEHRYRVQGGDPAACTQGDPQTDKCSQEGVGPVPQRHC